MFRLIGENIFGRLDTDVLHPAWMLGFQRADFKIAKKRPTEPRNRRFVPNSFGFRTIGQIQIVGKFRVFIVFRI